jgi:hypothetical protein
MRRGIPGLPPSLLSPPAACLSTPLPTRYGHLPAEEPPAEHEPRRYVACHWANEFRVPSPSSESRVTTDAAVRC